MNRGDRREPIFKDDVDRQRFVETLGGACAKTGWLVQRLRPHAKSFSSGRRDAPAESGRGDEVVAGTTGAEHYGEERTETAEAQAEQIIAAELKRRRWQEADLQTRPKGDAVNLALAARLRAETTRTVGWIAERLGMGTRGHLNHLLYRRRKADGQ